MSDLKTYRNNTIKLAYMVGKFSSEPDMNHELVPDARENSGDIGQSIFRNTSLRNENVLGI